MSIRTEAAIAALRVSAILLALVDRLSAAIRRKAFDAAAAQANAITARAEAQEQRAQARVDALLDSLEAAHEALDEAEEEVGFADVEADETYNELRRRILQATLV